ncbi:hypothetical protein [Acidianus sp. HS-5]|uniref:hypothetical protein n=1 Tax=Acidianus sp. HS-5 TaxID=2886040 RepID=UPI001F2C1949|nr:hypothetical protein [Acidianus sp. HS-5]
MEINIAVDEAGNPNDDKPFVISAVLIDDVNTYFRLYDEAIRDAQKLTGKDIKYFKWSEDLPKPSKLGKDVKGVFVNKVLSNLRGVSLIINKKENLSPHVVEIYGKILGLNLRKYVAGKRIIVHYDRIPILRNSDRQYILINFRNWTLASIVRIDFTGHDKCKLIHSADYVSGIVREHLINTKEDYKLYIDRYFTAITKNFEIKKINLEDY